MVVMWLVLMLLLLRLLHQWLVLPVLVMMVEMLRNSNSNSYITL